MTSVVGLPYPTPTSPAVTSVMRGNRRSDTKPELMLRSALHRAGLRFRKDYPVKVGTMRVRPDIVFPRLRMAVFVDGCFWHRCPDHGNVPATNEDYWLPKLARNNARDAAVNDALQREGWVVMRFWEHVQVGEAAEEIKEKEKVRNLKKGSCASRPGLL